LSERSFEQSVLSKRYVTRKENIIYGIANGGQCMSYSFLCSYITYFFVNVFNIDPTIISLMLFIEGMWDTVNDPLMGSVVDKTRTRFGKFRPYLMTVPVPLAITTIAVFAGPLIVGEGGAGAPAKIAYVIITYFLWEFFYTIGDVPFWSLSAAISPNPEDRTRAITFARFISGILGGIPGIIMPILIDLSTRGVITPDLRKLFFIVALVASVLGMSLFSLSGFAVKERVVQSSNGPTLKECLSGLYKNRYLRILILKEVLSAFGGIGGTFGTYYFVDVLKVASASLLMGVPGAIMNFLSYFFLGLFKKIMNNKQMIIFSKLFGFIIALLKYAIGYKHYSSLKFIIPLFMVMDGIGAITSGINAVLPMEMIGETVDYAEYTTGQRTEGISFSVMTFVGKFSNALSRSSGTFLLKVIGYKTSDKSAIVPQSAATKSKIWALYTVIPALLGIVGVVPMFFYDLTGKKREKMYKELTQQRLEKSKFANT
jgi:sugar (glycoside-pentoside-hexuronide) transporter